jgi:hypothetical protein
MLSTSQIELFAGHNRKSEQSYAISQQRPDKIEPTLPEPTLSSIGAAQSAPRQTVQTVTGQLSNAPSASDFLPPRPFTEPWGRTTRLRVRQLWEGTIVHHEGNSFRATLADLTNPANADEEAEFDLGDVSPDEHALVQNGASFYWIVGAERSVAGQLKNINMIQFRRLPKWTAQAIKEANTNVEDILALFDVHE